MFKCSSIWGKVGYILIVVGALNWGLIGLGYFFGGNWNVVSLLLGTWPVVENVVYVLVGVAVLLSIWGGKKNCRCE